MIFLKKYKKFLTSLFIISLSILISTLLWDKIELNYKNPDEIIGYYSLNNYSHLNDNLRYVLFISFPLIAYLIFFLITNNLNLIKIKTFLEFSKKDKVPKLLPEKYFFIYSLIIIILFFSKSFNYSLIDLFHEGQALTGKIPNNEENLIWSNNFIITSLFVDILNAKIAWIFTDIKSISSYRFYISILNLISVLLLLRLIFIFARNSGLKNEFQIILFLIFGIYSYSFFENQTFSYRDIPVYVFLICCFKIINFEKPKFILQVILGLLPLLSILWSLDRGIFITACYLPLFFLLLLNLRYKETFLIFSLNLFFFLIYYLFLGKVEFSSFIKNSFEILYSSDLLNGIIHPSPFSDDKDSARATKNMVFIILNGIILINYIFIKTSLLNKNFKIYLILYFIFSLIFYKIGITRSDGGHIKQGSSFSVILFYYFISIYLLNIIDNKNFKLKKNFTLIKFIIIFVFIYSNFSLKSFNNFLTFNDRLQNYIKTPDETFLTKDEKILIKKLTLITQNESCFQIFSYETAINYFINKPSCTKFYHIMNMGPKKNQLLFIEQLNETKNNFIIIGGNYENIGNTKERSNIDELSSKKRFPYIYNHIINNYRLFEEYKNWQILKKI